MHDVITMALIRNDAGALFSIPNQLIRKTEQPYVDFIHAFYTEYGELPTIDAFMAHEDNKDFTRIEDESPMPYIVKRFVEERRASYADYTANLVLAEESKSKKVELLKKGAGIVEIPVGGFTSLKKSAGVSIKGVTPEFDLPMPRAQAATGGLARGDFAVIHGMKGTRKTTISLWLALHWAKKHKILYVSTEMREVDVELRLKAMIAGFNPLDIRAADDPDMELMKYQGAISAGLEALGGDVIVYDDLLLTPNKIAAAAIEQKCTGIVVDGVYKLIPNERVQGGDWVSLMHIVNSLNRIALTPGHNMMILGTTQSNNEGEVGRTMAFGQDAAVLWRTEPLSNDRMRMVMEKNRHFRPKDDTILFNDKFQITAL